MAVHQTILDLIGNTPVVDVSKLSPNPAVKIFAKLENQNPAGSVKDRIAKSMVLQAEKEGLDKIFKEAGFEWREPGCSMCLGMNPDQLKPRERCASTSNRNFEGRQGRGGRTHLVSPGMAIAAAINGHLTDVREI